MHSVSAPLLSLLATVLLSLTVPTYAGPQLVRSGGSANNGIPLKANAKNPVCKPWYDVRDAIMGELYHGRCGDLARASVRLAFHDAGPFSLALQAKGLPNGAADGSMLTDGDEVKRGENSGLGPIVEALTPLPARFNVGPGDVLHLAGVLGVLACPGGPQIKTLVGRPLPKNIAPDNLLPNPNSPVKVLTDRFADMGFSIREMMALMGAHSTAKQRFVNPSVAGETLDSTPDVWDVRFYSETQQATAAPGMLIFLDTRSNQMLTALRDSGTFRLNSDVNFSHNATTQQDYNRFVGKQSDWGREYADAHLKMSLLGINQKGLTDCTEILPLSIDLTNLAVSSGSGKQPTDPTIDPAKLEAAIQQFRSLWL
ncbi:heme peroxidase [Mycena polygramma]|nr:heme peroxidase [Mycena polygramma]